MKLQILSHTSNGYVLKTKTLAGREHWVLPVVMMVEGVHHGSHGPLLYTSEELARSPHFWDGMSVTIDHPRDNDGDPTSASQPEFLEQAVGRVFNARVEGDKLKAEAWVDIERVSEVSKEAFEYLKEGKPLEVSIGAFSEEKMEEGDWNNEHYIGIATNIRPDHLALLPGEVGACSWDDGCGVRLNKKGGKIEDVKDLKKLKDLSREVLKEGYGIHVITTNETGFREISQNIQQKLDQMDTDFKLHFLEEVFDDEFVFRLHNQQSGETNFFRQGYVVDDDGGVVFQDDPVQVRKDVSFVPVENKKIRRTKPPKNNNSNNSKLKKQKAMSKKESPCEVEALINNEATQFTEQDKEWLEALSEDQRKKLVPKENKEPDDKTDPKPKSNEAGGSKTESNKDDQPKGNKSSQPVVEKDEDGNVKINGQTPKEIVKAIFNKEEEPEKFIDEFMPTEVASQMKTGLKMYREKRAKLIKVITENSKFTENNLKSWGDEDLQNLHDSVVPDGDYSVMGESDFSVNEEDKEEFESMIPVQKVDNKTDEKQEK